MNLVCLKQSIKIGGSIYILCLPHRVVAEYIFTYKIRQSATEDAYLFKMASLPDFWYFGQKIEKHGRYV